MERFISFLQSSPLDFYISTHNRLFRLIYSSCSNINRLNSFTNGRGDKYIEFTVQFKEPNPANRSELNYLATENFELITTEDNKLIEAFNIINPTL